MLNSLLKKITIFIMIFSAMFFSTSCQQVQDNALFLGNRTSLQLSNGNRNKAKKEIYNFLDKFEKLVSVNVKGSDVDRINNAKKDEEIVVSEHTYIVLRRALQVFDLSDGAFSPFTYQLSRIWGFATDTDYPDTLPTTTDVAYLIKYSAPEKAEDNIVLLQKYTVVKKHDEVKIDLGAIAKGYAAEKCADLAKKSGVSSGLVNIAGNIYIIGRHKDDRDFSIGISDPRGRENDNTYFAKVGLSDTSISVSGDYQRYFIRNEKRYCHIIDPNTGMPIDNGVISVIIIGAKGMDADAFSTAVMVKGLDKGYQFLKDNNLSGIIITSTYEYKLIGIENLTEVYEGYKFVG